MTPQKTQCYCSGRVTNDQFWVPWYHRRSQGTNISNLYHAPNYAPSIYDTTVHSFCHSKVQSLQNTVQCPYRQIFIIINWMSFKILLLDNKLPFDWIWQEFKRQLTIFTNAQIPNQRKLMTAPPDRLWIISSSLAKSNQNGYCNNQNHRKSKLPLKTMKKLWKFSLLKNPGNDSLIGLSSISFK